MLNPYRQRTVAHAITCSGIGVHSGEKVNLTIRPARENHGIRFVRTDLPNAPVIAALFNQVVDTSLATVLGAGGCIISTIEHLMAAFSGLAIDNVRVELDAYEMPIMDGSARPFFERLQKAGIEEQSARKHFFVIKDPVELDDGDRFVGAYPARSQKFTCTVSYDHPLIRNQSITIDLNEQVFAEQVCAARTFGFLQDVEKMKRFGLGRGGSLENVVVIDDTGIVNPEGLRFEDEFVRHKVLDCIGDFSLLGMPILGHIVTHKSGHAFNLAFLDKLFNSKDAWFTSTRPAYPVSSPANIQEALAI
ncbi:MAG: UDP-3-O-acyl-N-acetylglucosamine deacetylase [Desulfobacterales bacterium]|nr:UDP-3-O-acyl-N-acetylglucosamine deacetylase [Desulfobacterales bacterium]MDJ0875513.1 UDP-3-O-acyl-N-acetylglucosamine deacetylase [Desulfobacterales bacterium]MDJ0882537.1 UDP-3-O-acyl-N-acetylglucosamine deacetylase [Desulfobacterales bacterium]